MTSGVYIRTEKHKQSLSNAFKGLQKGRKITWSDKISKPLKGRNCHAKTNHNRNYWKWQLQVFMNLWNNANNQIDWVMINNLKGGR